MRLFLTSIITGLLMCSSGVLAQQLIPRSVNANGGGSGANSQHRVAGTIGQTLVGKSVGTNTMVVAGFWQQPGSQLTLSVAVDSLWNMVSVPVTLTNYTRTTVFPTSTSNAFAYQGGYILRDTLSNGPGYWLKFGAGQSVSLTGTSRQRDTIPVAEKWNLIGSISTPVATAGITTIPPGIIEGQFFGFSGGYTPASSIIPGKGYWVKVSQAGAIILRASGEVQRPNTDDPLETLNRLIIYDARGNRQALYFARSEVAGMGNYELPPLPPEGVFDVRFDSHNMVEAGGEPRDIECLLTSVSYPIRVEWEIRSPEERVKLLVGKQQLHLRTDGNVELSRPAKILVSFGVEEIPLHFALEQNYPNPFNPVTTIRYAIPAGVSGRAVLRVFDILGREVTTLFNDEATPGRHQTQFDATNLASGVYIYRLEAGSFSATKKLMVLK